MTTTPRRPWHSLSAAEALRALESSIEGLTPGEAAARRSHSGPNTIPMRRPDPWWRVLARQFGSVIVLLLVASAGFAAVLGRWIDAVAIMVAILVDVVLGFVQELRAARDVEGLRRLHVRHAHVRRAGAALRIDAADIVPGDIVLPSSRRAVTSTSARSYSKSSNWLARARFFSRHAVNEAARSSAGPGSPVGSPPQELSTLIVWSARSISADPAAVARARTEYVSGELGIGMRSFDEWPQREGMPAFAVREGTLFPRRRCGVGRRRRASGGSAYPPRSPCP